MQKKVKVGIIGTGNIGTDLLYKVQRSDFLECGIFTGRHADSEGIKRAKALGVPVSDLSIDAIVNDPDSCEIVFDATSAKAHLEHAPILKKLGKFVIDLTPSRVGTMCIPALNLEQAMEKDNVNLVTCGGQTSIPIIRAIMDVHPETKYVEIVGSISSKSAGSGTRVNIEEYMQTTKLAMEQFCNVPEAKPILILNPAEPPINMHNTIYASIAEPKLDLLRERITEAENNIKKYVPGYKITVGPIVDKGRLMVIIEVTGRGDFLPEYSGNLDIITSAALRTAEQYALHKSKAYAN